VKAYFEVFFFLSLFNRLPWPDPRPPGADFIPAKNFTAEAQRSQGELFFSFAFERPRLHGMQAKAIESQSAYGKKFESFYLPSSQRQIKNYPPSASFAPLRCKILRPNALPQLRIDTLHALQLTRGSTD